MPLNTIPRIPLEGACNARHLGGYPTEKGGVTRSFAFVRSEAPTDLTGGDIAALIKLGVRTVIDLRNQSEVEASPNPFASVPTVALYNIPIFPSDESIRRFEQMERGKSYCWMLDCFGDAYLRAFRIILQSSRGVLFHCAAGKDRTGLLAALLLLLAGVDRKVVAEEYGYTQVLLSPWVKRENAKTPEMSPEALKQLHGAYPEFMSAAIDHVENAYGGVRRYLGAIGLYEEEQTALYNRLVDSGHQIRMPFSA